MNVGGIFARHTTLSSFAQAFKNSPSMVVTDSGKSTDVRFLQPVKAEVPI